jgi:hypothetical protein
VPLPPEQVFAPVTRVDPTSAYPKYGPLPAVTAVHDQTGGWDAVGQTRRLTLSDGGHVRERLIVVDAPTRFAYELTDFQKLFGSLVRNARADWRFEPADGGTRIHWTYEFRALPGRGWIVAAIQRLFWAPYMRKVLAGIAGSTPR